METSLFIANCCSSVLSACFLKTLAEGSLFSEAVCSLLDYRELEATPAGTEFGKKCGTAPWTDGWSITGLTWREFPIQLHIGAECGRDQSSHREPTNQGENNAHTPLTGPGLRLKLSPVRRKVTALNRAAVALFTFNKTDASQQQHT